MSEHQVSAKNKAVVQSTRSFRYSSTASKDTQKPIFNSMNIGFKKIKSVLRYYSIISCCPKEI